MDGLMKDVMIGCVIDVCVCDMDWLSVCLSGVWDERKIFLCLCVCVGVMCVGVLGKDGCEYMC